MEARTASNAQRAKEPKQMDFFTYIKGNKSLIIILILLLLGIALILLPTSSSDSKGSDDSQRLEEYERELEKKIADLCSRVRGVGSVSVSVYFDSGFETVYAYNEESKESTSGHNSEKKYVTVGSGNNEKLVCIVEKMPNICGVAVVCVGGGDPTVQNALINLISSAYGVPKNKIFIAEGKK